MAKLLPKQYAKVLYELTKDIKKDKLDDVVKGFIIFLQKEQVVSKINYIVDEFIKYSEEKEGIKRLNITSAKKLDDKQLKNIANHFGEKVETEVSTDNSLIGGVRIKVGNQILDGSVKRQLEKLKESLV